MTAVLMAVAFVVMAVDLAPSAWGEAPVRSEAALLAGVADGALCHPANEISKHCVHDDRGDIRPMSRCPSSGCPMVLASEAGSAQAPGSGSIRTDTGDGVRLAGLAQFGLERPPKIRL